MSVENQIREGDNAPEGDTIGLLAGIPEGFVSRSLLGVGAVLLRIILTPRPRLPS
jgi:hypothetical protein